MTSQKVRELVNWGDAALEQSDLDDAESAYARAIEAGRTFGGGIALALDGLMRLASRYVMLGFLGRPHALHRYFIETDTLDVARDLKDLANLRDSQGDVKGCEMILTRILELKLDVLGPAHEETLAALQDAALVLQTQGKSPEHLYKLAFSRKAEDWVEFEPMSQEDGQPLPATDVPEQEPMLDPGEFIPEQSPVAPAIVPVDSFVEVLPQPAREPEPVPDAAVAPESEPEAPEFKAVPAEAAPALEFPPPVVPVATAVPDSDASSISSPAPAYSPTPTPISTTSASSSFWPPPPPREERSVSQPRPAPEPALSGQSNEGGFFQGTVDAMLQQAPEAHAESPFSSASYSLFSPPVEAPPAHKLSGEIAKSYQSKVESLLSAQALRAYAIPEESEPVQDDAWAPRGPATPAYSNPAWTGGASGVAAAPEEDLWARETSAGIRGYSEDAWTDGLTSTSGATPPAYSADKAWGDEPTEQSMYSSERAWESTATEPGTESAEDDWWTKETGAGLAAYSETGMDNRVTEAAATPEYDIWTRETSAGLPAYSQSGWDDRVTEAGASAVVSTPGDDIWTRETGVGLPAYSQTGWDDRVDEAAAPPVASAPEDDIWTRETGVGLPAYSETGWENRVAEVIAEPPSPSQATESDEEDWTKETFSGIPAYSEDAALTLTGDRAVDEAAMQHRIPIISPETIWTQETQGDIPVYSESARLLEPAAYEAANRGDPGKNDTLPPSEVPQVSQSQSALAAAASQFITSGYPPAVKSDAGSTMPLTSPATPQDGVQDNPGAEPAPESGVESDTPQVDPNLWSQCLDYLKRRIDHCACDQHLKNFKELCRLIDDVLESARPLANSAETANVKLATISRIDWKILGDLGEMYEKLSGTNAAAYELSLIYGLSVRIAALGAKHADTVLTLDRLCRLYKLLGISDAAQPVYRVMRVIHGMPAEQTHSASAGDETLPISRRVPSVPRQEGAHDPIGSIRAHFLILSKTPPKEDSIKIIQEVRAAFTRLSAAEVAPFLSRLLELTGNILGEDHPETAGCLFDAARFAKELQRPGYERAFQKAFHIYLKAGIVDLAAASCAYEFASVCKAIDDSEAGRLRSRAVAVCAMRYGLLHHRTRVIMSPLDTRLISLEFDFATRSDEESAERQLKPIMPKISSDSERGAALLRNVDTLEKNKVKRDESAVSKAVEEACNIYLTSVTGSALWTNVPAVEHMVLALMLEQQALKELDSRNFNASERIFEAVSRIRQAMLPTGHADHALTLFRRGFILARRNDLSGAEQLYKQSIDILEPIRGEQLLLHAAVLNNLGAIEFRRADYVQANRFFERAYNQMEAMSDVAPLLEICRANIAQAKEVRVFLTKLE